MYQTFINKYENSTIGLKIANPEEWTASYFHLDYPYKMLLALIPQKMITIQELIYPYMIFLSIIYNPM